MNASLRDSIFQWDKVVDAMEDCIFLTDANFKVIRTNKALRDLLGKTDDDIIGKHCWELVHGTSAPPDFCQIAEMMKSKKRESTIIELAGKYVRVTLDPILDDDGSVKGVVHIIRDIDVSERSNIVIRESEKKYHELVDTMNDVVFSLDFDGQVLDTSPSIKRIIGRSREELIGRHFSDFVHPDDLLKTEAEFVNAIQGKGRPIELKLIPINGTARWIRVNALLIMRDGEPDSLLCVLSDIHEKKLAEESLIARDIQFKKLSSQVPGMTYQFKRRSDGTYCVPFTSEAIRDIFGCSPEDVNEDFSPIAKVILPDDLRGVIDSIEYSGTHLTPWQHEYRVQIPGQPVRWMFGRSIPEKLTDGSILWHGFNADVTDLKDVEEKLRESEEKLRESNAVLRRERDSAQHYLNDVRAIIVNLDGSGNVTLINKKGCEILGRSESDIVGSNWFENYIPENMRTEVKRVFNELMAGRIESMESFDNTILASDGKIRAISWHNALLKDESGRIIGTLSAGEDISERLQMEINLRTATENLSKINTNLIDAKLRSQTYFDFLAHDIANIMSPIMAYAELMSKGEQYPPEIVSFTGKIVDQAQKATSLIHNLRKLEMLEDKNLPDMNVVDIKRIFSFVENSIRHKYPEKKPTFVYHLPEDIPIKSRGGEYIDFVIRHVFDNAVRHAQKDTVNIDVRIDKEGENVGGKFWRILIEDDGPGISDRMKKEITTPLDPAKRYSRGVASSLAFCSAAVVGIGGELHIEDRVPNDQSKGTRVTVWIPVYD